MRVFFSLFFRLSCQVPLCLSGLGSAFAAQLAPVRETEVSGASAGQTALALGLAALFLFIALKLLRRVRRNAPRRNKAKGPPSAAPAAAAPGPPPPALRPEEAERLFRSLQRAWDARDMKAVAAMTTPSMAAQVNAQAEEDPEPSQTAILKLRTEPLRESAREGGINAEIYFTMLLREGQDDVLEAREVWLFTRSLPDGPWLLDAIHQVKE